MAKLEKALGEVAAFAGVASVHFEDGWLRGD